MDKREFLKTSGALFASSFLPKLSTAQTSGESRTNWAGNYTYSAKNLDSANTIEDIKHAIKNHSHLKALGARHSFNGIADSTVEQISLKHFDQIELDPKGKTVRVGASVTYGQLAPYIDGGRRKRNELPISRTRLFSTFVGNNSYQRNYSVK